MVFRTTFEPLQRRVMIFLVLMYTVLFGSVSLLAWSPWFLAQLAMVYLVGATFGLAVMWNRSRNQILVDGDQVSVLIRKRMYEVDRTANPAVHYSKNRFMPWTWSFKTTSGEYVHPNVYLGGQWFCTRTPVRVIEALEQAGYATERWRR